MTETTTDDLVREYLARVETRAAALPPDRRHDLLADLTEHIATARAESPTDDEASVRTILDRLGEPDEILEAEQVGAPASAPRTARFAGLRTAAVVVGLIAAAFVPLLGWIVAVALVWSTGWPVRLKAVASVVSPGLGVVVFLMLFWTGGSGPTSACTGAGCVPPEPSHLLADSVAALAVVLLIAVAGGLAYVIRGLTRRRAN